jgi:hypothetical protein
MQQCRKPLILAAIMAVPFLLAVSRADSDSQAALEYKLKAAFLYNFLKFVEWPSDPTADSNGAPVTIVILCKEQHGAIFDEIASRKVKDRPIIVRRFTDFNAAETKAALSACQMVFVTACQQEHAKEVIAMLRKRPVLLVGEQPGFIEGGGMINFLMQEGKVCFEINADCAEEAGLAMGSQLLRLAKRVIKAGKPQSSSALGLELTFPRGA